MAILLTTDEFEFPLTFDTLDAALAYFQTGPSGTYYASSETPGHRCRIDVAITHYVADLPSYSVEVHPCDRCSTTECLDESEPVGPWVDRCRRITASLYGEGVSEIRIAHLSGARVRISCLSGGRRRRRTLPPDDVQGLSVSLFGGGVEAPTPERRGCPLCAGLQHLTVDDRGTDDPAAPWCRLCGGSGWEPRVVVGTTAPNPRVYDTLRLGTDGTYPYGDGPARA